MADRRPDFDHILSTRPEGEIVRGFERQARALRHEQRVGQVDPALIEAPEVVVPTIHRFRATRNTLQVIPDAAATTMLFTTEDYNPQGAYDSATGIFTVPSGATGVYSVAATVAVILVNASSLLYIAIFVNGTEVSRGDQLEAHSAGAFSASVSDHLNLVPEDEVLIKVFHSDGANRNTEGTSKFNHFSMARVA